MGMKANNIEVYIDKTNSFGSKHQSSEYCQYFQRPVSRLGERVRFRRVIVFHKIDVRTQSASVAEV